MLSAFYPARTPPLAPPPATSASAATAAEGPSTYLTVLMLVAISYQLLLCALTTHLGLGGDKIVMVAEASLLAACLPLMLRRLPIGLCLTIVLILAHGMVLFLLRSEFNPKPLRDVLMPLVFIWVGMNSPGEVAADRVLRRAVWLVLGFAAFEWFFLDLFTRLFDVYSYYLSRGAADPDMGLYRDDHLVASGIRPEDIGRTILPILGAHRVSSVFIEPVSLGNFAVICAAWGLAKDHWRDGLFFFVAAVVMVTAADSRFGLVTVVLLVLLRLLLLVRNAERIGVAFPFLGAAALIGLAMVFHGERYTDSFLGRLSLTGRTLMEMDARQLFGAVAHIPSYFDMGYAYILANFGLAACLLLWFAFWHLPMTSATGRRFHAGVALYLSLILCVSGTSVFALKTSAMVWFLFGSVAASSRAGGRALDAEAR